jgi:sterol desaturase/sphingolipid hydroxylase (fatty acid hydroxylase superfamily)
VYWICKFVEKIFVMPKANPYKALIRRNKSQPRLFKNKFLERLTYTSPLVVIVLYGILTFTSIWYYVTTVNPQSTFQHNVGWYLFGLVSWTLGEYLLHRFVYHDIADASYHKKFHYIFHGVHHEYPNDTNRIVLPPVAGVLIAGILFGIFYGIFWLFTGTGNVAFLFTPGFVNGYLIYMLVHYTVHKVPSPRKYNFWWRHHNIHHFQQHDRAFGVTSPLWDIVFRTMPEKGRKTVIER